MPDYSANMKPENTVILELTATGAMVCSNIKNTSRVRQYHYRLIEPCNIYPLTHKHYERRAK